MIFFRETLEKKYIFDIVEVYFYAIFKHITYIGFKLELKIFLLIFSQNIISVTKICFFSTTSSIKHCLNQKMKIPEVSAHRLSG